MNFLFAPDSFKGSLKAVEICNMLETAAKRYFENCKYIKLPVADGGEGTIEALLLTLKLQTKKISVHDPLMRDIDAIYAQGEDFALVEMAQTSGLCLLSENERCAAKTSSYGLGEAINYALEDNFKTIYIGIGGSATNDGGMGMLCALGVKFFDDNGNQLLGKGEALQYVKKLDLTNLNPKIKDADFIVISDVQNPIVGELGATMVFGKQKGANMKMLEELEYGMQNYCDILEKTLGKKISEISGGGAAGGTGAALVAFLNARLTSGIDTILDKVGFEEVIKGVDLIITGEGRIDAQSAYGKVISGISMRAGNTPVMAIVGGIEDGFETIYEKGVAGVFSVFKNVMSLEYAMENANTLFAEAADRMFRILKLGYQLGENSQASKK